MNKKILIAADSSCDLPEAYLEKHDIKILPFSINLLGKSYLDKIDINTIELFKKIDDAKEIAKTSAITPAMYADFFDKYSSEYDIIFFGLGTGFSSSTGTAMLVAKDYDNVYVVDSKNLSAGNGLLINKAVKFREEGMSAEEIYNKVQELIPLVRTQFVVNTLKYLHMGGRCSGTARIFGTALKLKPIIRVMDNKMVVTKKPIGFHRGMQAMINYFEADKDNIDEDMMTITHCHADEDAKYLLEHLPTILDHKNIMETYAGCVISTHCGPRTIGILYILKHPEENSEEICQ